MKGGGAVLLSSFIIETKIVGRKEESQMTRSAQVQITASKRNALRLNTGGEKLCGRGSFKIETPEDSYRSTKEIEGEELRLFSERRRFIANSLARI